MNNYFVILAAGKGSRFNNKKPKQYYYYKNKELYEHSLEKSINSKLFKKIVLVIDNPKKIKRKFSKNIIVIKGGKQRSDSSIIALKYIKRFNPDNVLIHDAARPNFSIRLLKTLLRHLQKNKAVIPFIKSKDTIKYKLKNEFFNLDRDKALFTQTPQAFKFKNLYEFSVNQKNKITDEATLFINNNQNIKFIQGENINNKNNL